MEYLLHLLILIGIYLILAVSLNLVAGYAGLLSIAHAAFFGVGAYVSALMALHLHTSFWLNLPIAMLLSGLLGLALALPSLRVRDDYLVIATFAFQVIVFSILNNWVTLTGGPMGLPGIPAPTLGGWSVPPGWAFLGLIIFFCALCLWFSHRLVYSPFGRVLQAIREDEILTQALGKDITYYKVLIFVVAASMAAVAGALYAGYISFIDPSSFTVMESIFIISIVIIGGAGSFWGPVLGAAVLVTLPELLRFLGLPGTLAANLRQILYGTMLVVMMLWRPQGLWGNQSSKSTE